MKIEELKKYSFTTRPLTPEEGGGILIKFLDFNNCFSDGETIEEALNDCIESMKAWNMNIPEPFSY